MRNILIRFLSVWVFELELVNVANVKISSSNVANFQLGIGDLRILCGTLLFVSRFSTLS